MNGGVLNEVEEIIKWEEDEDYYSHWMANQKHKEFDLVISGGGYRVMWVCSIIDIFQKWIIENKISIPRISGTSAGVWAAILMCNNDPKVKLIDVYTTALEQINNGKTAYQGWSYSIKNHLQTGFYKKCNKRLYVCCSKVTFFGLQKVIISSFESDDHLLKLAWSSAHIPFISHNCMFAGDHENTYLDGSILCNLACFTDKKRPQLLLNSRHIDYSLHKTINYDENIITHVLKGKLVFVSFVEGNDKKCISWYSHKTKKRNNITWKSVKLLFVIIVIAGRHKLLHVLYRFLVLMRMIKK